MSNNIEFYQLCSINTTADQFIEAGFKVISFGTIKREIMNILGDKYTAHEYNLYNNIIGGNEKMKRIYDQLEKIVFKESRGGKNYQSIGWENGNSYLRYHSGIIYKWFK